ncbi:hypothetical protein Bca4012_019028 [Brassica carinata]
MKATLIQLIYGALVFSPEFCSFIDACLQKDAEARPTADQRRCCWNNEVEESRYRGGDTICRRVGRWTRGRNHCKGEEETAGGGEESTCGDGGGGEDRGGD